MTEEEAFWTFACIVENLMPVDYFQQMVGAKVDQQIIDELLKEKFPRLAAHFEDQFYMASMTTLQWFTTIFTYSFNFDVLQRLWDLFFIKGNKILFRISLAIFHLMEPALLRCTSITQIMEQMNTISQMLQDHNLVLQVASMPRYKIKGATLEAMRARYRQAVVSELEQFTTKQNARFSDQDLSMPSERQTKFEISGFLQAFATYKGIQQFYIEDRVKILQGGGGARDDQLGYINKDEGLVRAIRCSKDWPVCVFDFSLMKTLQEFFVFRVRAPPASKKAKGHPGSLDISMNDESKDLSLLSEDGADDLRRFITNEDYVGEEHER